MAGKSAHKWTFKPGMRAGAYSWKSSAKAIARLKSARSEIRTVAHIQTANNRHSGLKDFLRRYRGVSSKYLGNYLRWFERCELLKSSARSCLATAIGASCIQFAN